MDGSFCFVVENKIETGSGLVDGKCKLSVRETNLSHFILFADKVAK